MKLSTIAKTSLALGILTTGVITTNAQSVDAATQQAVQTKISAEDLKAYYMKKPLELKNVSGELSGNVVTVLHHQSQHSEVELKGNDKDKLTDNDLKDIDVFLVGEGTSKQAATRSIGGITKPNSQIFKDQIASPQLSISSQDGDFKVINQDGPFNIYKEQISLKELDFKLRKHLIEKHDLYSKGNNNGVITVHMKDKKINNNYYSFVLDNKLQEHRMGDVIDATQIDRIDVEYK
ncbi:superantigen-like protein [Staphylococcus agnetis]|uniref:exotoxin beta-grasp domain-containing protein n=1 Tax=Staphylococcus agnetis TaxID=985762 RepID=UPI0021CEE054|nr:exotoxin beta-grasp domain-containing protein [Staphylococcus agnetis]UXU55045.1 superantigen-like protein [Staphylococcus agnetis]